MSAGSHMVCFVLTEETLDKMKDRFKHTPLKSQLLSVTRLCNQFTTAKLTVIQKRDTENVQREIMEFPQEVLLWVYLNIFKYYRMCTGPPLSVPLIIYTSLLTHIRKVQQHSAVNHAVPARSQELIVSCKYVSKHIVLTILTLINILYK